MTNWHPLDGRKTGVLIMFATNIVTGIFLALAVMLPGQALAQFYRPHEAERSNELARLETEDGFDLLGERRDWTRKGQERQSRSWTVFGRVGPVSFEKDDGLTLRRGGPKLGRLTIG